MNDWILTTADMKFPPVTVDTVIEILDLSCTCYIIGKEFESGKILKRRAGECIWYRTSIYAYRLLGDS
jgi:hypothetical protein